MSSLSRLGRIAIERQNRGALENAAKQFGGLPPFVAYRGNGIRRLVQKVSIQRTDADTGPSRGASSPAGTLIVVDNAGYSSE